MKFYCGLTRMLRPLPPGARGALLPALLHSGSQPNVTWPSYMIDAPATFNRVMSWMSYAYKMEGELYWGTNFADSVFSTGAPATFPPLFEKWGKQSTLCA